MEKRVLLVEGKDDLHVMKSLFKVRGIPEVFQVQCPKSEQDADESGGDRKLLDAIPRWLLMKNIDRLAVVLDADNKGPKTRWSQISDRLKSRGYGGIPKDSLQNGVFDLSLRPQTQRSVRFAVWVMPDNHSQGMIEDFVVQMIREDDDMLPRVDDFLESIPTQQQRFSPNHRSKAWIHSWLAIQEEPGRPMGQAITRKYLDANRGIVGPFLDWITNALITDGPRP